MIVLYFTSLCEGHRMRFIAVVIDSELFELMKLRVGANSSNST